MQNVQTLTIAIPTYNRLFFLKENIDSILRQLNQYCKLLIIDNCSEYDIKKELGAILHEYKNVDIEIIVNHVNIGGNANILRCFEVCKTNWLYIIGDDDFLLDNSINTILNDIKQYNDYCYFNYKWNPELKWSDKRPLSTCTFESFINNVEGISQILFISSNVYNLQYFRPLVHLGHHFNLSNASHLAMLLIKIDSDSTLKVLLSDHIIVNNGFDKMGAEFKFNNSDLFVNIRLLLDLPMSEISKKILYLKLSKSFTLFNLLNSLLVDYENNKNKAQLKINYKKAVSYSYIYEDSFLKKVQLFFFENAIKYPRLLNRFRKFLKRRQKHVLIN